MAETSTFDVDDAFTRLYCLLKFRNSEIDNLKLISKIFKNIIDNPKVAKFRDLNANKIIKKVGTNTFTYDLLFNVGFILSQNDTRLIFDMKRHEFLKDLLPIVSSMYLLATEEDILKEIFVTFNKYGYEMDYINRRFAKIELQLMGFDSNLAQEAVKITNGDVQKSIELLFETTKYSNNNQKQQTFSHNTTEVDNILTLKRWKVESERGKVPVDELDTSYLYLKSDLNKYPNQTDDEKQCELKNCRPLASICSILSRYHRNDIDSIFDDCYQRIDAINDFLHLLNHSAEFEDVHKIVVKNANNGNLCDLHKCLWLRRHHRDRLKITKHEHLLKELYSSNDVVTQQILDVTHCYFYHAFDIGYRMTRKEKQIFIDEAKAKENIGDENDLCDKNVVIMHEMQKQKEENFKNVNNLEKLNNKDTIFMQHDSVFSYGYRYFYWQYYEEQKEIYDPAHQDYSK
eukprot:306966_1